MHTYVVTSDGRTYTAISRVSSSLGPSMQTLNTIGGSIGWLFAIPGSDQAVNGYSLTGKLIKMERMLEGFFSRIKFKF